MSSRGADTRASSDGPLPRGCGAAPPAVHCENGDFERRRGSPCCIRTRAVRTAAHVRAVSCFLWGSGPRPNGQASTQVPAVFSPRGPAGAGARSQAAGKGTNAARSPAHHLGLDGLARARCQALHIWSADYACRVPPLPVFDDDGLLPAGDYELTLDELRASALVSGNGVRSSTWDARWRGGESKERVRGAGSREVDGHRQRRSVGIMSSLPDGVGETPPSWGTGAPPSADPPGPVNPRWVRAPVFLGHREHLPWPLGWRHRTGRLRSP